MKHRASKIGGLTSTKYPSLPHRVAGRLISKQQDTPTSKRTDINGIKARRRAVLLRCKLSEICMSPQMPSMQPPVSFVLRLSRLVGLMIQAPFPDALLEQMKSCHNAATEFLRQYWSAVLPTSSAALGAGTAATNAATKSAKAAKMAQYLSLTEGKVIAVVHTATIERIDPARVRAVSTG